MKILFTTKLPKEGFKKIADNQLIFPKEPKFTKDELLNHINDCDILVSTYDYPIDKQIIEAATNLKLIANFGVGFNNVDINTASQKGILVTNTPDPVVEPTAEHAFSLMLGISHRVAELDRKMRDPHTKITFGVMNNLGVAIYGKTLGIIGMGNIGKSLARRAKACGMNIIYHNRKKVCSEIEASLNAKLVSLDELMRTSDYITLHLPYTSESHHIINSDSIQLMKQSAIIINTARGACIHEESLVKALKENRILGAALDVYEFEPKITPELLELDNVLLSPHIGTGTIDGRLSMCECVSDNIIAFKANKTNDMNIVKI